MRERFDIWRQRLHDGWRRWALGLFVFCAVAGFAVTVAAAIWLAHRQRQQNMEQTENAQRAAIQAQFTMTILCRSSGRTNRQCAEIARGTVLPPNLTLKQIRAEFAKLTEARVQKLFVGPPGINGKQGRVGPGGAIGPAGPRGPAGSSGRSIRGPRGATGSRGPAGARGAQGERGAAGSQGQRGPAGPQGAPGPPGPPGAGGACVWVTIRIPSAGTYTVCTKP